MTHVYRDPITTTNPQEASQWHPTKNQILPENVTKGMNLKVWWKCDQGDDHEWEATISNRCFGDTGCPFCYGKKVCLDNCLITKFPAIAAEWHPTRNETLTPFGVVAHSGKKVWWKCPVVNDHEWEATIASRTDGKNGRGCPCCDRKKIVPSNCLASTHPEIAQLWHSTKNKNSPHDVSAGSGKKVWWQCPVANDHEWQAPPALLLRGNRCPCCAGKKIVFSNCLVTIAPQIAKKWHPTKNGKLTPFEVLPKSGKRVWWKCPVADDHEWEAPVGNVGSGSDCPCCHGLKVVKSNCLATHFPQIADQWHSKNQITPWDITPNSKVKVWWQCKDFPDHSWLATPNGRVGSSSGCPMCKNSKGEEEIKKQLKVWGFRFQKEYRINDCVYKRALPFDFAVFLGGEILLIEFHGEQHYRSVEFFGGHKHFKYRQKLDGIKLKYCQSKHVKLLVIPYWKFDSIQGILSNFLGMEINSTES